MKKKIVSLSFLLLFILPFILVAQTTPEKFLGHKVGADRKVADYNQIQAYFKKLDKESGKIKVLTIGKSTLNKPIIMAIITSEENMAKLDTYRQITKKLRDARDLTPKEAKKLAREGKVIVSMTCNIHSDEIGSSQMALELAYKLVTGKTPFDADKVLEDVIFLLVPTINPDGAQMAPDWYRKHRGTKYEGISMPWLYHHYAGHNNNRDWFMLNLAETKAFTKVLYQDWISQVHMDKHQMGSMGLRIWIPPFDDPPTPSVHPLVWRGVDMFGMNMAYDFQKNNQSGVGSGDTFPGLSGWWDGACDNTPWFHNVICLLTEEASIPYASPIYIDPAELSRSSTSQSLTQKRMAHPDPWPGGWWRLRDIVDYDLTSAFSMLKTVYLHKEDLLYNFYKMCKDSIEKKEQPFAFVIPSKQWDYPTALRMLDTLMFAAVEIHQAKQDFNAGGKNYPAGSFVVLMSQPYRPYAQALLEKQKYPDLRPNPGDPPVPPGRPAGWTLPLKMGVKCIQIDTPFKANLTKLDKINYPSITPPQKTVSYIILDSRLNTSYSTVFSLIKEKAEIYRSKDIVKGEGFEAAAGSFIIKNTPQVQKALPGLLDKWHVKAYVLNNIVDIPKAPLKKFRVGLYQSWRTNMDEGWTRYIFDDLSIPFTTLHNKDFKGTKKKKVNLKANFDVIVFADEDPGIIISGRSARGSRYGRSSARPPEYEGGIGKQGIEALKSFVEQGGILVTLASACGLAFNEFGAPAANALERFDRSKFLCTGSILRVKVDNRSPIGYGMPEEAAIMFYQSMALRTRVPSKDWDRKVVARFPEDNILLSGWLLGEDVIARKAAVVDTQYKKGRIILLSFTQFRAQTHGTYKFLLNALLYPEVS